MPVLGLLGLEIRLGLFDQRLGQLQYPRVLGQAHDILHPVILAPENTLKRGYSTWSSPHSVLKIELSSMRQELSLKPSGI